jgi:hypothetical protein
MNSVTKYNIGKSLKVPVHVNFGSGFFNTINAYVSDDIRTGILFCIRLALIKIFKVRACKDPNSGQTLWQGFGSALI